MNLDEKYHAAISDCQKEKCLSNPRLHSKSSAMCRIGRAQEPVQYAVCRVFLQSETCNLPSGPAGWLGNAKTTAALPGPSLANTSAHTVQESHRPYTTWQAKQHWLLAMSYFVTSRPPANCGLSDVPWCYFSRSKTPHLDGEETDCAKPSPSLKGTQGPLDSLRQKCISYSGWLGKHRRLSSPAFNVLRTLPLGYNQANSSNTKPTFIIKCYMLVSHSSSAGLS